MPPRLPERYRLNIRLGSDGDIEEWLAQDESLDRPVLIRYLAPESSPDRHAAFLSGVRAAAALTEIHIQKVFAAGETTASAYSVSEWDGGVTIADRLRVGEGLPVEEFLPNATGMCAALARFHDVGGVHGAIDVSAIHFSAAHPAKLGAFGRQQRWSDASEDTMALAEVLRAAITGTDDAAVFPSQVIDGIPVSVDEALRSGVAGRVDAMGLATALSAVTYDAPEVRRPPRPWRTLSVFGAIVVLISVIAAVGLAADFDPDSPFLYPFGGDSGSPPVTAPVIVSDVDESSSMPVEVSVYDPLGDGTESDEDVGRAIDGDRLTGWATEAYSQSLGEFKSGVGLVLEVDGSPSAVYVTGTAGTTFSIGWSTRIPDNVASWEHVGRGTLLESETRLQLPRRVGGVWRLWLTNLPERGDGSHQSRISVIRFVP